MSTLRTLLVAASMTILLVGSSATNTSSPVAAMTAPPSAAAAVVPAATRTASTSLDDVRRANAILGEMKGRYRYLDGVTVRIGATPNDEQAVAYYTEGEIVISRTHTVGLEKILAHEIWHVIDWRDNGQLDWGESLPPRDQSPYLSGTP